MTAQEAEQLVALWCAGQPLDDMPQWRTAMQVLARDLALGSEAKGKTMAKADYRLCDVCGEKAFYDARLNYECAKSEQDPDAYRIAGKAEPWGASLDTVGDWAVICKDCAKTHRTQIVPIAADA